MLVGQQGADGGLGGGVSTEAPNINGTGLAVRALADAGASPAAITAGAGYLRSAQATDADAATALRDDIGVIGYQPSDLVTARTDGITASDAWIRSGTQASLGLSCASFWSLVTGAVSQHDAGGITPTPTPTPAPTSTPVPVPAPGPTPCAVRGSLSRPERRVSGTVAPRSAPARGDLGHGPHRPRGQGRDDHHDRHPGRSARGQGRDDHHDRSARRQRDPRRPEGPLPRRIPRRRRPRRGDHGHHALRRRRCVCRYGARPA